MDTGTDIGRNISGSSIMREIVKSTIIVLISLILEGCSAVVEQLTSEKKPQYALAGMLMAFAGFFICILDIICKLRRENHYRLFGSTVDMFGLTSSTWGCFYSVITFVCFDQGWNNPIKFSPLPFIFMLSVAISILMKSVELWIRPKALSPQQAQLAQSTELEPLVSPASTHLSLDMVDYESEFTESLRWRLDWDDRNENHSDQGPLTRILRLLGEDDHDDQIGLSQIFIDQDI